MKSIFRIKFVLFAAIILLIFPAGRSCFAQKLYAPNSLYLELGGNGLFYSINYDRMISENVGGRIGITYFPAVPSFFSTIEDIFLMPVTINILLGNDNNKLELGAGIVYAQASVGLTFDNESETGSAVSETFIIGYRYQQRLGGFLFRIGFTPVFRFNEIFLPWGGISVGFSF